MSNGVRVVERRTAFFVRKGLRQITKPTLLALLEFGNLEYEDRTMVYFLRLLIPVWFIAFLCSCEGAPSATENDTKQHPSAVKVGGKGRDRPKREADDEASPDARVLKEAKIGTSNEDLIAYLKEHSESDDDLLHLDRLIRQLGDNDFDTRESAVAKLIKVGLVALPKLKDACTEKNKGSSGVCVGDFSLSTANNHLFFLEKTRFRCGTKLVTISE